jgi:hypothetical protein
VRPCGIPGSSGTILLNSVSFSVGRSKSPSLGGWACPPGLGSHSSEPGCGHSWALGRHGSACPWSVQLSSLVHFPLPVAPLGSGWELRQQVYSTGALAWHPIRALCPALVASWGDTTALVRACRMWTAFQASDLFLRLLTPPPHMASVTLLPSLAGLLFKSHTSASQ